MKKNIIPLDQLSAYFPYKVKAKFKERNDKSCRKTVIGTVGAIYNDSSICCYETVNATPDKYKLLLRPLSDLINEIEIDGKKFIPIVELAIINESSLIFNYVVNSNEKIFGIRYDDNDSIETVFAYHPQRVSFGLHTTNDMLFHSVDRQYQLFQKLFEWHFDVFGLIFKDLAEPTK